MLGTCTAPSSSKAAYPGKWLLIYEDTSDAQTETLLFVREDPDKVGKEMLRHPKDQNKELPLYVTYSFTEDEAEQAAIVSNSPADL